LTNTGKIILTLSSNTELSTKKNQSIGDTPSSKI